MGQFIPPPISVALTVAFVTITFLLFVAIPLAVSAPVDKLQSCEPPKLPDCFNVCGNTMFYLSSKDTCEPCISCPAGTEPNTYCGDFKGHGENATCSQCKPGHFSTEGSQLQCRQCSKCTHDRRRVERQCTATSDTECGECIEGYGTHPDYVGTAYAQFCFACVELHPNISSQQESCLATPQMTTKSSALQTTTKSSELQTTTKPSALQMTTKSSALQTTTKPSALQMTTKSSALQTTGKSSALQPTSKLYALKTMTKSSALQPTTKLSAPNSSAGQPTIESSSTPKKKKHYHPEKFTVASGIFRPLNDKRPNTDKELSLKDNILSPANKTGIIIGATFVLIVLIIAVASQNPNCLKRLGKMRSATTEQCHCHRNGSSCSCTCNTENMPILSNSNGQSNQTLSDSLNVQSVVNNDNIDHFCQLQSSVPEAEPLDVQTISTQFKKFTVDPEVKLGASPIPDDGTCKPLDSLGGILSRDNDSMNIEVRGSWYQPAESSAGDRPRACSPEHDSDTCEKAIGAAESFHGDHLVSNSYPTGNPPVQEKNPNNSKLKMFASKPEEHQDMQQRRNERKSFRPFQDEKKDPEQERFLVEDQNVILPKTQETLQSDNEQQQRQHAQYRQQQHQRQSHHSQPASSPPELERQQLNQQVSVIVNGSANFLGPVYINNHGQGTGGVSGTHQAPHVPPPSTHKESPDGYVIRQCTDESSKEKKLP